jgi:gas vesicle protein GvpL/GvpF
VSLLLRAITSPPTAEAEVRLAPIEAGPLVAWTTRLAGELPPVTRDDILAHHTYVADVFACVEACLPARFPTLFEDDISLRDKLVAQETELTARLEAVRGACEMALTAVWTTRDQQDPMEFEGAAPGRRYLLQRAASERRRARAHALADTLEARVASELRQAVRHVCPSETMALSLALLVNRTSADAVRTSLVLDSPADVRILVHGPWAPYTFAGSGSTSGRRI